jgi:predicted RNase H-like nuclease (RuvC/YqgF family)
MNEVDELKRKKEELRKQLEQIDKELNNEESKEDYKRKRKKARLIYEKVNYPQPMRSTDSEQNAEYKFIYD